MSNVLVVPAFPGLGKTYFTQKHNTKKRILDSDSSMFSWKYVDHGHARIRNDNFPENYLNYIAWNYHMLQNESPLGDTELGEETSGVIFTSTHKDVLQGLNDYSIPYTVAVPLNRDEIFKRYRQRGDSQDFIDFMDYNYQQYMQDIRSVTRSTKAMDSISQGFSKGMFLNSGSGKVIGSAKSKCSNSKIVLRAVDNSNKE